MTRDQKRAQVAYARVQQLVAGESAVRDAYERIVKELGSSIRRSGLVAAMAGLERKRGAEEAGGNHESPDRQAANRVFGDLAMAGLPGLAGCEPAHIPARIRGLPVADYMLVTRELLAFVVWLKRAVEALFPS